jgi:hypothetical protein
VLNRLPVSHHEVRGNEDLRKFSQFVLETAPRTSAGTTDPTLCKSATVSISLWTFFEAEATIEILTYSEMFPTTEVCNIVRMGSQMFVRRDGY